MKTFLRIIQLSAIAFLLTLGLPSCRAWRIKKDYQRLVGSWKEEWGAQDVQYQDVYQIAYTNANRLIITCQSRPHYIVSGVNYDGKVLRLQLEIRDNKYNTGSALVQYELKFVANPPTLIGTALNHEQKAIPVKWIKQQ
ncbi:MAG: hypothetical protein RMJ87_05575 [Cytophagales bacterium]|nr:hypothetical protein [Bernardetiaceae bacterium]MDW8204477.1 hypothetical protein [Cytophagales bacterium]